MLLAEHICAASLQGYWILVLKTVLVLALIAGGAWAVVRFGGSRLKRFSGPRRMRVIEKLALEPRRSIYMIDIDGKTIVVGVSDMSIRLLTNTARAEIRSPSDPNREIQ